MHVIAMREEVARRFPWAAINLYRTFEEAKSIAMARMENSRIMPLA